MSIKFITSPNNEAIKFAKRITNGKQEKHENRLVAAEGEKLVNDALTNKIKPIKLIAANNHPRLEQLKNYDTIAVSPGLLKKITTLSSAPNLIGIFELPEESNALLNKVLTANKSVIVLDKVQDPGNLGTIIRTSKALGAAALFCINNCCLPTNTKAVRASMGSIFRLPIFYEISQNKLIEALKNYNYSLIATAMNGKNITKYKFNPKSAIFLGSEGKGLSKDLQKICDFCLAIPMQGKIESLNVATSAAICLYEWNKQQS